MPIILIEKIKEEKNIEEKIKKVNFHDPATVVYWKDGTKTVVLCHEKEKFDPEKGLAMAIIKYMYGNSGSYYELFKKYANPDPNAKNERR